MHFALLVLSEIKQDNILEIKLLMDSYRDSKWDWYVHGGRYDDGFELGGNSSSVNDILNIPLDKEAYTLAVLTPDGKWYEWQGKKETKENWHKRFINILKKHNKDNIIATIIDCHI